MMTSSNIVIHNMKIRTWDNQYIDLPLPDTYGAQKNIVALPGLIDPHVHFRIPGTEEKEDWKTGSKAAIAGGYTSVFDMPNNTPPCINKTTLQEKTTLIERMLDEVHSPLAFKLWIGATKENIEKIPELKKDIIGIKVFMGASTGTLLMDNPEMQKALFKMAGEHNIVIGTHAEDEEELKKGKEKYPETTDVHDHSKIRDRNAAIKAVSHAITLAKKYHTKLYLLHVSTAEEVALIRQAKNDGITVYAEVTPHHLFLSEKDYDTLGTKAQMNPPLRTEEDQKALWQEILDGTIDTIGTDHAPHTLEQKALPYGQAPSGVPGIETALSLMIDAYNKGTITLERIVDIMHTNSTKIFSYIPKETWIIVDLDLIKTVRDQDMYTKCGWSPFAGRELKGWPLGVVINNIYYPSHT